MNDDTDDRTARALELAGLAGDLSADDLRRARVRRLADELADAAGGALDLAALAAVERELATLRRDDDDDDRHAPARLADFTAEVIAEVELRAAGGRRMVPVPWPDLEALYDGGLRPGVHVLTGGTGTGKTGWALAVALEAARAGFPVLYAGLELDRVSIVARLAAQLRGGGGGRDDTRPGWADLDWPRGDTASASSAQLRAAADELAGLPLYVAEPPAMGWSVDDLERELEHVREAEADALDAGFPVFVVVDFLQLVGPGTDGEGRTHPDDREIRGRIRRAAYAIRQLTRGNDVCALLVSAIARAAYDEVVIDPAKAAPDPGDLVGLGKESGEIEYAAHTVTCLARTARTSDVWAIVAKNRTGRAGYVALDFHGKQGRHYTAAGDRREAALALTRGEALAPKADKPPKPAPKGKAPPVDWSGV